MTKVYQLKKMFNPRDLIEEQLGEPTQTTGKWAFWCCPLHGETEASLGATVDDGWYCFGCHKGGDIIDWVQEYHNLSFKDAVRKLGGDYEPLTEKEKRQRAIERAERAEERLKKEVEKAQQVIKELKEVRDDIKFHQQVNRGLWHERYGVEDKTINYYRLGYCPEFQYKYNGGLVSSPSLTIPFYRPGGYELFNLRHRLLQPKAGRYRPHRTNLGQPLFYANLNRKDMPNAIVVEGGIKAAVLWQELLKDYMTNIDTTTTWIVNNCQVVGVPGSSINELNLRKFEDADKIWMFLDPDAYPDKAFGMAKDLGQERTYTYQLPGKPDDLLVEGTLKANDIYHLMQSSRRM